MPKKKSSNKNHLLNLRNIIGQKDNYINLENEIEMVIDNFITKFLKNKKQDANLKLSIIVGKGINSNILYEGKNLLRVVTERYLRNAGVVFKNGFYDDGGEGVIVFYL